MITRDDSCHEMLRVHEGHACAVRQMLAAGLQNFQLNECGPVNIIIGDGGNIEGVCKCFTPVL